MFENNEKRIDMAVVVGERKHPTPIFSDNISYIVLNIALIKRYIIVLLRS